MQEEGVKVSEETLVLLGKYLKKNDIELPFMKDLDLTEKETLPEEPVPEPKLKPKPVINEQVAEKKKPEIVHHLAEGYKTK